MLSHGHVVNSHDPPSRQRNDGLPARCHIELFRWLASTSSQTDFNIIFFHKANQCYTSPLLCNKLQLGSYTYHVVHLTRSNPVLSQSAHKIGAFYPFYICIYFTTTNELRMIENFVSQSNNKVNNELGQR